FSQYLPQLVLAALVPLLILAFVFPLDLLSAFVLLVTAPLIPFFMILIGSAADALTRRQWKSLSLLSAHFLDVLQGLATLKMFGRSREQIETIARVSFQFRDATLSVLRVAFLSAFALEMIATISTAIIAVEIGLRLLYAQIEFEQAFFVLVLAPDFYLPLRLLGTRFHAGMTGVAAGARVFEILEMTADHRPPTAAKHAVSGQRSAVVFDDVHYTYDGMRAALNGVSFSIARGERVVLAGHTGAGKSTVVSLLLRFIEPTRGEILCDGKPLRDWSPRAWREQIAWVPQLPYLFNDTVANNIRLARPDASLDDVIRAAQLAHADEFIRALPQGYDTLIGERGARLSGGQAQRIALARAFLKDAPILIFDEPTAHLDPENEALIQDAIERLMQNRTVLIISHRPRTLQRADKVVVLEQGRVVEMRESERAREREGEGARERGGEGARERGGERASSGFRVRNSEFGVQNSEFGVRNSEFGVRNSEFGVRSSEFATRNSQFATRHSQFAIRNSQFAIRNSQLATQSPISNLQSPTSTFLRLLHFVAPFKAHIALAVALGAATIGSSIGLMATSAYIIAHAARHPSIAELSVPIVGVRFFGIARGVFRYLERLVSHTINFNLLARLRVWFYESIEPHAPAILTRASWHSGDVLTRVISDIETLQNFYVRVLAPPLVAIVIAIITAAYLASFATTLALVVLAFMFLVGIVLPILAQQVSKRFNEQTIQRRAQLNTQLVDGIQGIADLIAYGREEAQLERVRATSRALVRAQMFLAIIAGAHNALGNALTHLAMWSALVIAIPLVNAARFDGVYLAVIALAVLASFEGVLALPLAFQYLDASLLAARRLFEFADRRPPTDDRRPRVSAVSGQRSAVVFDRVTFRYALDEPCVLNGLSFEVRAGERVAIVGPSGVGKSSIVNLLLRFWDYEDGHIWIDGRELRDIPPDEARALFAVVPQTIHLFNATIRENLLLARPDATEAEIIEATRRAQIHDFIVTLPDGYDTRIGEQGLRLSGGERQRLALARALLKRAPILILDEATAHLDAATARAVWEALRA
ncbi:MAG: thiol reductant ABC exporter subunit CydD, partial [Anaerolineae bacterium]|nr:thiol reductant ABC exporter subunit CydD [Anaerolineae bacterium]